jgi:hypothetical protein
VVNTLIRKNEVTCGNASIHHGAQTSPIPGGTAVWESHDCCQRFAGPSQQLPR